MKLKCLIVDDEPLARLGLMNHLKKIESAELVNAVNNPVQAAEVLQTKTVDLIFLDIQMPYMNGLNFIKSQSTIPPIIIVTAYPEHALEGYELDIIDFLVKPVSYDRFYKAFLKAEKLIKYKSVIDENSIGADHFFIKADSRFEKIFFDKVLYLESMLNYVKIITQSKTYITYATLKSLEQKFPRKKFVKIHKSYIVSISEITALEGHLAFIGQKKFPISRSLKEHVYSIVMK